MVVTRILADLPQDDIDWLDRLASEQGKSRAAILREAVSAYRGARSAGIERYFGMWKDREELDDSVESQRQVRGEWKRRRGSAGA